MEKSYIEILEELYDMVESDRIPRSIKDIAI